MVDPLTGKIRSSTKADLAASALLVDHLEELDLYKVALNACDVPQSLLHLPHAAITLSNTSKPFYLPGGDAYQTNKIIEMAASVVGGPNKLVKRPILIISACPASPLKLPKNTCEIIMECARSKTPVFATPMALAGASAPVTLAGALVLHNAEVLSSLVLHQVTSRGAPILYGSVTTSMDLRFGTASMGAPEMSMMGAAVVQLAMYYGLPSNVGGGSDSKVSDGQAAHEITFSALLPALAGANILTGAGSL